MSIWKVALAGTALAGFLVGPASAQMLSGPWYVKGFGGFTVPDSDDFRLNERNGPDSLNSGLDYDTGYALGVAAGLMVTPNVAVELEYAYRNADADLKRTGESGTTESNAFMVNALYNFAPIGPNGAWLPYVGGGLGTADLNVEAGGDLGGDFDSDYNFAYQLIAGTGYQVTPTLQLLGEVRFFGINDQDFENKDLQFKSTYQTIDILFGAKYTF